LSLTRAIENKWIASTCGWTPFDGMKTKGWPVATVLRGAFVMRDFAATGGAQGRPIRFVETLEAA
jgi:dihydroorotase